MRNKIVHIVLCGFASFISHLAIAGTSPENEFQFARLVYKSPYEQSRALVDWPHAETHFSRGVKRLTRINTSLEGALVTLDNDEIFDYPWIYVVETGYMWISTAEAATLSEYLLRGGFLLVDDFHGASEWANFEANMKLVFPNRIIKELAASEEVFHLLYELDNLEQIPGIHSIFNNRTWEKGGRHPRWRGIFDDHGRLMVAINFNQDLGDAWEHANEAQYPHKYTSQAYRLGINYLLYAMTH